MARHHLLLVDANADNAAVLDLTLRQAGYSVAVAHDAQRALAIMRESEPNLVLVDTAMPQEHTYEMLRAAREESSPWSHIPFVYLTDAEEIERYPEGLRPEIGDCLFKPVYLKEVTSRVNLLLDKRRRDQWARRDTARTRFSGSLEDLGVVDLIQTIDLCKKSGELTVESEWGSGKVWFQDGVLLDATFGQLQAEAAIYRMLRLDSGNFGVEFKGVKRARAMSTPTHNLLLEGLRQLDEWHRLCEQLPPLAAVLIPVDPSELGYDPTADLTTDAAVILRKFVGGKSARSVIQETSRNELETLELISQIYFMGAIGLAEGAHATISGVDYESEAVSLAAQAVAVGGSPALEFPPPSVSASANRRPQAQTQPMTVRGERLVARTQQRGVSHSGWILGELDDRLRKIESSSAPDDDPTEPYEHSKKRVRTQPRMQPVLAPPPIASTTRGRSSARTLMIPFAHAARRSDSAGISSANRSMATNASHSRIPMALDEQNIDDAIDASMMGPVPDEFPSAQAAAAQSSASRSLSNLPHPQDDDFGPVPAKLKAPVVEVDLFERSGRYASPSNFSSSRHHADRVSIGQRRRGGVWTAAVGAFVGCIATVVAVVGHPYYSASSRVGIPVAGSGELGDSENSSDARSFQDSDELLPPAPTPLSPEAWGEQLQRLRPRGVPVGEDAALHRVTEWLSERYNDEEPCLVCADEQGPAPVPTKDAASEDDVHPEPSRPQGWPASHEGRKQHRAKSRR